ncbi:hypothetical protein L6164_023683 [Bauhinia variegata]|uniref:Uncharacterized protein n=1 Tax=Bauhinia variegata TaxID=167791 RepID=A0ACB9MJT8_BAUVA|nr:hypothetical protein L6164_023683 [Bauhinia variegata]
MKPTTFIVIVVLCVYDLLVTGDDASEIHSLKQFLDDTYKIKDLGALQYFLGLKFIYTPASLLISQRKYTVELCNDFNVSFLPQVASPLPCDIKLALDTSEPRSDPSQYCGHIRRLKFLLHTRQDNTFAVKKLEPI